MRVRVDLGGLAVLLWVLAGSRAAFAVFGVVLGIGVLDELRQSFVPGREADLADLLADAAGAAAALYLMQLFTPFQGAKPCAES